MNRIAVRAALALAAVLYVSGLAAAADTTTADPASGKKININQASAKEFTNLPRVGTKQAERIVEYRKEHGQFARVEDLMEVKGVGEKLFTTLKPYLALSGPTTLTEKVSSKGSRGGSSKAKSGTKSSRNTVPVGKGR
ncbi:MAG TPA: helix-hairpin-helix domain-containing protein [Thermoanaerobaculia bacterium]|nr:helix-hairpin-helix domain-containing protein [Thermoanaerobaculia bacterium]HMF09968.1 helix-hairpin-helix domain-containing protein [Thermoanaerobaculia bacterium]